MKRNTGSVAGGLTPTMIKRDSRSFLIAKEITLGSKWPNDILHFCAIACRGHDPPNFGPRPPDRVEIDKAAADLEGADRRMVLVLDPQLGADPPGQQRPAILRGRRHHPMD